MGDVVVTNPDTRTSGTSGNGKFTYVLPAPVVASITPSSGPVGGGTAITDLHGTDFVSGATVTIDGVACTSVTFVSSVQLTCETPVGSTGAQDVVVTNPDTQDSGSSGAGLFTYTAGPLITAIGQPTGSAAGGDTFTITGTGLCGMFSGAGVTVTVGGAAATVNSGFGGISVNITTPAGSVGPADIVLTYLGVDSGISGNGRFAYV